MALNTDRLVHGACESVECQIDVHSVLPSTANTLAYSTYSSRASQLRRSVGHVAGT